MSTHDPHRLAAAIVRDAGGQLVGRTRLQKVTYLMQLVALHSGFDEFKRLGRGLGWGRDMHVPSSRVPDLW